MDRVSDGRAGDRCPYCHGPIGPADGAVVTCAGCAPHFERRAFFPAFLSALTALGSSRA